MKSIVSVRSANGYDVDSASVDAGFFCDEPTMAQQNFKDECDINTIVRRFGVTGQIPVPSIEPQFGDFSGVSSYHDAMNLLIDAQETFDAIPSDIRKQFDNDPGKFVDFTLNPDNRDQLKEWGLLSSDSFSPPVAPLSVVLDAVRQHESVVDS